MSELSVRTYGHAGSVIFALLGMVLPIATFSGLIAELGLTKLGLFDALTQVGIIIYVVGLALAGLAAFRAYRGAGSKLFGILGGLILLLIYPINNPQINQIDTEYGAIVGISAGVGHWAILLAALLSLIAGFLPGASSEFEMN